MTDSPTPLLPYQTKPRWRWQFFKWAFGCVIAGLVGYGLTLPLYLESTFWASFIQFTVVETCLGCAIFLAFLGIATNQKSRTHRLLKGLGFVIFGVLLISFALQFMVWKQYLPQKTSNRIASPNQQYTAIVFRQHAYTTAPYILIKGLEWRPKCVYKGNANVKTIYFYWQDNRHLRVKENADFTEISENTPFAINIHHGNCK